MFIRMTSGFINWLKRKDCIISSFFWSLHITTVNLYNSMTVSALHISLICYPLKCCLFADLFRNFNRIWPNSDERDTSPYQEWAGFGTRTINLPQTHIWNHNPSALVIALMRSSIQPLGTWVGHAGPAKGLLADLIERMTAAFLTVTNSRLTKGCHSGVFLGFFWSMVWWSRTC